MKDLNFIFLFVSALIYADISYAAVAPVAELSVSVNSNSSFYYDYTHLDNTDTDVLIYPKNIYSNLRLFPHYKIVYPVNKPVHLLVAGLKLGDNDYKTVCDIQIVTTLRNGLEQTQVNALPVAGSQIICTAKYDPNSNTSYELYIKLQDLSRGFIA